MSNPHETEANTSGVREQARQAFDQHMADALIFDEAIHRRILYWLRILVLCNLMFVALAALAVTIRTVNYYESRGTIEVQRAKLAEQDARLAKLRAEVAIRDARFLAIKEVFSRSGADIQLLLRVQHIADDYALGVYNSSSLETKTADEIKRELCARFESEGIRCLP